MATPQIQFGEQVKKFRLSRGWSQEELAQRAGRHWTYIGGIERGERNVTIQVIHDLASAFGIQIRAFFPPRSGR
jgi:transcriptional regulator with XRE-family HTH domain